MFIKLLQWNLNGYYINLHELQILIQTHNPDIILHQETHHTTKELKLIGYKSHLSKPLNIHRGGTGLFIKNNLKHTFIKNSQNFVAVNNFICKTSPKWYPARLTVISNTIFNCYRQT